MGSGREVFDVDRDQKQMWRLAARYSAVGLEFGIAIAVGYFVGAWLDKELSTTPYLMILFVVLGAAAGMKALLRVAKKVDLEKM